LSWPRSAQGIRGGHGAGPYGPSADCDICPAVKEDVYLFVRGTPEEYIAKVKEYNTNSAIVANARRLKDRVDEKLTEEDKQNTLSILDKIYSSSLC
uniref:Uncharacterized protein n=1 Tax=Moschus moschiferus TaxID=68415 RepID=A0A8C6FGZ8_MOSMO